MRYTTTLPNTGAGTAVAVIGTDQLTVLSLIQSLMLVFLLLTVAVVVWQVHQRRTSMWRKTE